MIRAAILLAALALPAQGQTARVISGEHADFTRLVVELPGPGDWTVGRTSMGYAFATTSGDAPTYELSRVWDRIPRTRLQALRADPQSGALLLTLACLCHVFPFEYRPGMIVLDIKDGAAPPGSVFETAFDTAPDTAASTGAPSGNAPLAPTASPAGYNWIDMAIKAGDVGDTAQVTLPLATGTLSLDPLRDELLEQISRGAVEGVVDMQMPASAPDVPPHDGEDLPWTQIRIGELPGIAVRDPDAETGNLPGDGQTCAPDGVLALPEWGAGRPALDLLAEARSGLYGEFDTLDPAAALRAVQLHLYLGFGAEAAQYAALAMTEGVAKDQRDVLALYLSMARLVDGEVDPATPFAGMLGCMGPAALWAALAHDRFPPGSPLNTDAILQGFLALPAHLRRTLGPNLAERFLAAGDASSAKVVRDAVQRIPHIPVAEVALLDARADLEAGNLAEARSHAEAALAEGDQSLDGLTTLVEANLRDMTPLSPDIAAAVAAFAGELGGTDDGMGAARTLVLALALSGQADAAFASLPTPKAALAAPTLISDLWLVVTKLADDNAFLRHAVGPDLAGIRPEVALGVAERLVGLGFGDAALAWVAQSDLRDPNVRRLKARAELARGDPQAALLLLSDRDGAETDEDLVLRAQALVQLGSFAEARAAYTAAGLPDQAERLLTWEGDWTGLAATATPRAEAATALDPGASAPAAEASASDDPTVPDPLITDQTAGAGQPDVALADSIDPDAADPGPLTRGEALLAESASARAAIDALLAGVTTPAP